MIKEQFNSKAAMTKFLGSTLTLTSLALIFDVYDGKLVVTRAVAEGEVTFALETETPANGVGAELNNFSTSSSMRQVA